MVMSTYYVLTQNIKTDEIKLIETIKSTSLGEAKKLATRRHNKIVMSCFETGEKLVVVGEIEYKEHYYKEA